MFPEVGYFAIEHFNGLIILQSVGQAEWMVTGERIVKIIHSTNPKYSAGQTWDWDIRIAHPITAKRLGKMGISIK